MLQPREIEILRTYIASNRRTKHIDWSGVFDYLDDKYSLLQYQLYYYQHRDILDQPDKDPVQQRKKAKFQETESSSEY